MIEFKEKGWFWNSSKKIEIRFTPSDLEICKSIFRLYGSVFNENLQQDRRNSESIR